jgi:hypothetical protein
MHEKTRQYHAVKPRIRIRNLLRKNLTSYLLRFSLVNFDEIIFSLMTKSNAESGFNLFVSCQTPDGTLGIGHTVVKPAPTSLKTSKQMII